MNGNRIPHARVVRPTFQHATSLQQRLPASAAVVERSLYLDFERLTDLHTCTPARRARTRAGARDLALPKLRVRAACSAGRLTRVVRSSCDEDHALPTASRPRSQRRSSRGARLDVEVPRRPRWRWRPAHRADQPERLPRPPQPAQPAHGSSRRTRGGRGGRGTPGRAGHPRRWAGPTQLGRPPQAGPAPPSWGGPTQAGQGCHPRPGRSAHPGRAGPSYPGRHPRRATYVCAPNTCRRFLLTLPD